MAGNRLNLVGSRPSVGSKLESIIISLAGRGYFGLIEGMLLDASVLDRA